MCCKRLAGNTGCKNDAKNRHLSTIAQLCRAISSQLRHVSTIGKKLVKQQYLLQMSLQYSELRPTNGWDRLAGLGYLIIFQRVSRLGSVNARQSSSGRQPNFAALNRERHLWSAGRPSRLALAHILVWGKFDGNSSKGPCKARCTLHTTRVHGPWTRVVCTELNILIKSSSSAGKLEPQQTGKWNGNDE